jgi:hypothetical protein
MIIYFLTLFMFWFYCLCCQALFENSVYNPGFNYPEFNILLQYVLCATFPIIVVFLVINYFLLAFLKLKNYHWFAFFLCFSIIIHLLIIYFVIFALGAIDWTYTIIKCFNYYNVSWAMSDIYSDNLEFVSVQKKYSLPDWFTVTELRLHYDNFQFPTLNEWLKKHVFLYSWNRLISLLILHNMSRLFHLQKFIEYVMDRIHFAQAKREMILYILAIEHKANILDLNIALIILILLFFYFFLFLIVKNDIKK